MGKGERERCLSPRPLSSSFLSSSFLLFDPHRSLAPVAPLSKRRQSGETAQERGRWRSGDRGGGLRAGENIGRLWGKGPFPLRFFPPLPPALPQLVKRQGTGKRAEEGGEEVGKEGKKRTATGNGLRKRPLMSYFLSRSLLSSVSFSQDVSALDPPPPGRPAGGTTVRPGRRTNRRAAAEEGGDVIALPRDSFFLMKKTLLHPRVHSFLPPFRPTDRGGERKRRKMKESLFPMLVGSPVLFQAFLPLLFLRPPF